jgi:quercetin dioxygenase-like cupin family protein
MGGRIVFRDTAATTDGQLMRMEFFLQPGCGIAEAHWHPLQRERFEVIRGSVAGRIDGVEAHAEAGESSEIGPGVRHGWWNAGDEEAQLVVEFRPALRTEDFFEEVFAMARAGKTDERGVPKFLPKLVLLSEYGDEFRPADVPDFVAQLLIWMLAPFARWRRRRPAARPGS